MCHFFHRCVAKLAPTECWVTQRFHSILFLGVYTCLPRKIGRDKNREISILNEAIKDFLSVLSSVTDGWKLDVFYYGMTSEEKKSAPLVCVTDSNSRDNDWTFGGSRIWLRFWRVWNVEKLRVWKSSSCLESGEGLFVSKCWVRSELGEGHWRADWLTRATPQLNSTLDHGTKCSVTLCCYQHSCIVVALPTSWSFYLMYHWQSQRRFRNQTFLLTTPHLNVTYQLLLPR